MTRALARILGLAALGAALTLCGGAPPAGAAEHEHGHAGGAMDMGGGAACRLPIEVTEEAERNPGGALYAGPPVIHHDKADHDMPEMQGAHQVHRPQHGGAFFMAPDQMHHVEALVTDDCGLRVAFYNAFTEPIGARRFQAFVTVVPRDIEEPELNRFLSPSADGTFLRTALSDEVSRPFGLDLWVKFPESDQPELFTVRVPAAEVSEGPPATEVAIANREVAGEKAILRFTEGEKVRLRWTTDEAAQIHVHGYDLVVGLDPGKATLLEFDAYAAGRFPVTAHGFGATGGEDHGHGESDETVLLYIEVYPR